MVCLTSFLCVFLLYFLQLCFPLPFTFFFNHTLLSNLLSVCFLFYYCSARTSINFSFLKYSFSSCFQHFGAFREDMFCSILTVTSSPSNQEWDGEGMIIG